MGKTYRFNPARVALEKRLSPEEIERRLRGKLYRRKAAQEKREEGRKRLLEELLYGLE